MLTFKLLPTGGSIIIYRTYTFFSRDGTDKNLIKPCIFAIIVLYYGKKVSCQGKLRPYSACGNLMNGNNDLKVTELKQKEGVLNPDMLLTLPPRAKIGEVFCDRYKITSYLGEGAMGVVYGCMDLVAQIEVAIKMFPPELSNNQEMMEDIRYNYQLIQALKHDNIAALKNLEPDPKRSGSYLLVMELARGTSLQELILACKKRQRPFSVDEALPLLRQIASALDYAHANKVVHRDVKPGNIIVSDEGKVFVLDFGLAARIRSTIATLSAQSDDTSGTPAYKSPEQWKARRARASMDQYALGVVAYEMLANALPFESENNGMLRDAVLYEEPERIEGISDTVWNALLKALAKDPDERFENCMAFVEALAGNSNNSGAADSRMGKRDSAQDYFELSATFEVLELRAAKRNISLDDDDEFLIKKKSAENAERHNDYVKAARFLAEAVERGKQIIQRHKEENARRKAEEESLRKAEERSRCEVVEEIKIEHQDEKAAPSRSEEESICETDEKTPPRAGEDLPIAEEMPLRDEEKSLPEAGKESSAHAVEEAVKHSEETDSREERNSEGASDKKSAEQLISLPHKVKLAMIRIKAGSFIMGSPENEIGHDKDEKLHRVTLTRDFWIGKFPVTQEEYEALMGHNPSHFKRGRYPVESVSWDDARAFCERLNRRYSRVLPRNYQFDLPTEAQWEYACRSGIRTALNSGKKLTSRMRSCFNLDEVAWYCENANGRPHTVGRKQPNASGLFDMHGNVGEWCRDWHGFYRSDETDPVGPASGSGRVYRGGSWYDNAGRCRSAYRSYASQGHRSFDVGFRIALVPIQ